MVVPLEGVWVVDLDGYRHVIWAANLDVLRLYVVIVAHCEVDPWSDVLAICCKIAPVSVCLALLVDLTYVRGV